MTQAERVRQLTEQVNKLADENTRLTARVHEVTGERDAALKQIAKAEADASSARTMLSAYESQVAEDKRLSHAQERTDDDPYALAMHDGERTHFRTVENRAEGESLQRREPDRWFEDSGDAVSAYHRRSQREYEAASDEADGTE